MLNHITELIALNKIKRDRRYDAIVIPADILAQLEPCTGQPDTLMGLPVHSANTAKECYAIAVELRRNGKKVMLVVSEDNPLMEAR